MPTFRSGLKYYGDRVTREVKEAFLDQLDVAGKELVAQIRHNLSTPGPEPSSAGEYPHRQSGGLAAAVTHEVDRATMTLRVSVDRAHQAQAIALELGTHNMRPRPFLTRTFIEFRRRMMRIMSQVGGGTFRFRG